MKSLRRLTQIFGECRWLLALVGVCLAPAVWATIPLYSNGANSIYTIPGAPPPQIDAKAFYNEAGYTFEINYETYEAGEPLFEPLNTLFYTNSGTMIANGGIVTNNYSAYFGGLLLGENDTYACGFQFDQQTTSQDLWAGTFYNSGAIRCGARQDGNDTAYFFSPLGSLAYYYVPDTLGQCIVSATNIIDQGTIGVSYLGTISLTGGNIDLSQGQLAQDAPLNLSGITAAASFVEPGRDWHQYQHPLESGGKYRSSLRLFVVRAEPAISRISFPFWH